jgi:hypothetical protein
MAASVAVEAGSRMTRYCTSARSPDPTFLESYARRINIIFCFSFQRARIVTEGAESRRVFSGLLAILDDLSECVLVDGFSRPNRDDFCASCTGSIDDSRSSYWQAPVALKLVFERFPAVWILKDVCQRGTDFTL